MNTKRVKYVSTRVIPRPHKVNVLENPPFRIEPACRITVASPLNRETVSETVLPFFEQVWHVRPELEIFQDDTAFPADAYSLNVSEDLCRIGASDRGGLRNALKTLRQLSESERGVPVSSRWIVPSVGIEDAPTLKFRGIHFCIFPETPLWELEKEIRLAAYYKFNYAVLESWGMIRLESHPGFCWKERAFPKSEIARLVKLAASQGLTLIPQLNIFGHATMSRSNSGKHVLLDRHPEYAPLFEPDGWTWCLSNPYTRTYLEEIAVELYELFGRPGFFHLGCDEAYNAGSCALCAVDYREKLKAHLQYFHDLFQMRGVRVMMWHDMLLEHDDLRWKGYIACGKKEDGFTSLLQELPKDILICDWQYGYPEKDGKEPSWETTAYFADAGFEVLPCPWCERKGIRSLSRFAASRGLPGILETTWDRNRNSDQLETLFAEGSAAAWNPEADFADVCYREYLNRHLREMAHDIHLTDYRQFGSVPYQVAPECFL